MEGTRKEKKKKTDEDVVYLRREIGLLSAISFIIGTVVGSGIFIAPKGVLMNTGSVGLSLLVWGLCGILSMFGVTREQPVLSSHIAGALCYAELGTSFTKSGGHYTYLMETLGPLPAFLRVWAEYVFIRPAVASYVSLAFGSYVVEPFFAPCVAPVVLVKLVSVLAVSLVIAANCWSVTMAARSQVILTVIKMFALVLIIIPGVVAMAKGKNENFQNGFELDLITLDKLPLAFYNGLYAYSGWFILNNFTEEVKNPNRTFPLAIIFSMVTVTVFYVLVNMAYYTMMTPAELLQSEAVAVFRRMVFLATASAMSAIVILWFGTVTEDRASGKQSDGTFANRALHSMAPVIPFLVALSCFGTLNGGIFGAPRMMFVAAREGQWPPIFSMIHIRRKTPLPAVLLTYPLTVLILTTGEIYQLINLVSFCRWFFLALATLGMLIHRHRFPLHPRPFKVPLVIAASFTVVCFFIVALSLYSDPWNTGWSCALTLTGVPIYFVTVYRFRLPPSWRRVFNFCSKKLQILLEVVQQEIQTY